MLLVNTHIKSYLSSLQKIRLIRQVKRINLWEAGMVISSVVFKARGTEDPGGDAVKNADCWIFGGSSSAWSLGICFFRNQ